MQRKLRTAKIAQIGAATSNSTLDCEKDFAGWEFEIRYCERIDPSDERGPPRLGADTKLVSLRYVRRAVRAVPVRRASLRSRRERRLVRARHRRALITSNQSVDKENLWLSLNLATAEGSSGRRDARRRRAAARGREPHASDELSVDNDGDAGSPSDARRPASRPPARSFQTCASVTFKIAILKFIVCAIVHDDAARRFLFSIDSAARCAGDRHLKPDRSRPRRPSPVRFARCPESRPMRSRTMPRRGER